MKKFIKISSFLLAFAMIVTSFVMFSANNHVHAADKPVAAQTWKLNADVSALEQGPIAFKYLVNRDAHGAAASDPTKFKTPVVSGGVIKDASDRTVFEVSGGVLKANVVAADGDAALVPVILFTAPADATYKFNIVYAVNGAGGPLAGVYDTESNGYREAFANTSNTTQTATVTLKAGDIIFFYARSWSTCVMDIKDFTVSLVGSSWDLVSNNAINTTDFSFAQIATKSIGATGNDFSAATVAGVEATGNSYRGSLTGITGFGVNASTPLIFKTTDNKFGIQIAPSTITIIYFEAPACGKYKVDFSLLMLEADYKPDGYMLAQKANIYTLAEQADGTFTQVGRGDYYTSGEVGRNPRSYEVTLEGGQRIAIALRTGAAEGFTHRIDKFNISYVEDTCVADSDYTTDATHHWITCENCGELIGEKENHTGGTATCVAKKECTVCGETYGDFAGHTPATDYSKDADYHWKECSVNGCGETIDGSREAHDFTNGDCVCGQPKPACDHANCTKTYTDNGATHIATYTCGEVDTADTEHVYSFGSCEMCEHACEHGEGGLEYEATEDTHTSYFDCCGKVVDNAVDHDFTNGNCVCGEAKPVHTHDNCTKTYTNNGDEHIAEWSCGEVDANDTEHDFTNGDCVCGAEKPAPVTPPAPPTGDTAISISIALAAMAILGFAVVTKKRH